MHRAGKCLVALSSVAATVALLEAGARVLHLQTGFFLAPSSANCLRRSSLALMELRPECTGEVYQTRFHTNALGLRGDEVQDDGSLRILALGDSCTWGWRVEQGQSYPAVLQQRLDARFGPHRFQVINAGIPGYTSLQGLLYLRERGLALRPEVVIIALGFNDVAKIGDVAERIARERWLMPVIMLDDFLLEQSAAYRWVRWQANQRELATENLSVCVPVDRYRENLVKMVELARAEGAKVLFLNFPQPGGLMDLYRTAFAETAEALGVPLLRYTAPRIDFVHPTAEGDRMLAEAILERLQAEGFLRSGNGSTGAEPGQ